MFEFRKQRKSLMWLSTHAFFSLEEGSVSSWDGGICQPAIFCVCAGKAKTPHISADSSRVTKDNYMSARPTIVFERCAHVALTHHDVLSCACLEMMAFMEKFSHQTQWGTRAVLIF